MAPIRCWRRCVPRRIWWISISIRSRRSRSGQLAVDRSKASLLGVDTAEVVSTLAAPSAIRMSAGCNTPHAKYPVPIRLRLDNADKVDLVGVLALPVRSQNGQLTFPSWSFVVMPWRRNTSPTRTCRQC